MAIKLDMNKAYDRVEWVFLERVMRKIGFCDQWIGWVTECVYAIRYRILINGALLEASGKATLCRPICL